jgi:hypothetical protein
MGLRRAFVFAASLLGTADDAAFGKVEGLICAAKMSYDGIRIAAQASKSWHRRCFRQRLSPAVSAGGLYIGIAP